MALKHYIGSKEQEYMMSLFKDCLNGEESSEKTRAAITYSTFLTFLPDTEEQSVNFFTLVPQLVVEDEILSDPYVTLALYPERSYQWLDMTQEEVVANPNFKRLFNSIYQAFKTGNERLIIKTI